MKHLYFIILFVVIGSDTQAQGSIDFERLIEIESSPLKDQQSSGTCWSFATTSFIETEAIRLGKGKIALSPIFYVAPTYIGKAEKFIEKTGESWFDAGDLSFSVMDGYRKYGAVPEEIYDGLIEGDWQHDHLEMDNLLFEMVTSIGTSGYGRIKPESWKRSIEGVLHAYLGKVPDIFMYQGKEYTPLSFATQFVGIQPKDYIEITSYTHFDFYGSCVLDIPANWNGNTYLNLPIQDFERVVDSALESGYSIAWDGDASEPGFDLEVGIMELPIEQENIEITQTLRQITFENETTTDDHNMHIIGLAKNKKGEMYYLLKNSEGDNSFDGYVYMSKNALLLKTISFLVHKDAIPLDILRKTYLAN